MGKETTTSISIGGDGLKIEIKSTEWTKKDEEINVDILHPGTGCQCIFETNCPQPAH